jgi:predicted nucleic acid-binding protein
LRRWFDERILPTFADRVLPFDPSAARILAGYRVPEHAPFDDALIAAVAQSAEMTVATRNTKHFEPLGVPCFNPWDTSPATTR